MRESSVNCRSVGGKSRTGGPRLRPPLAMESLAMANSITNIRSFPGTRVKVPRIGADSETKPKFYLVGTMRAVAPGGDDILPRSRKTRALLACLCLARGERVSRSRLAGL